MAQLTKDEIRLLHLCIKEAKFEVYKYIPNLNIEKRHEMVNIIESLEKKCLDLSKDDRRSGITSQEDFNDLLKRLVNKNISK